MTATAWTLVSGVALGFAMASLVLGTPTMFGVSLAIGMVAVIAADLTRICTTTPPREDVEHA
ncbi:hypothetical protein [Mycobacterium aquaticum]|uniref:Uncharacterized protein n=1 Tax=Mycobacterium aquaticum TaxID=1927124 RepID=A0A1X0A488_9MYCO|nr:hypothetical protein [Mycobacterium aquaticum]ORA24877.1 hypothetical protein BST13_33410 [Mycobacterium aquaticum]